MSALRTGHTPAVVALLASALLALSPAASPNAVLRDAGANGFVGVAGWVRGKTLHVDGVGGARARERFPACSVTKLFTAVLVLREVERGRLGLDEPARTYLPEFAEALRGTTIRDLLTHASTLANMDDAGAKDADGVAEVYRISHPDEADPLATLRRYARRADADAEAGTRYSYNNMDAVTLAAILARVRKATYPSLVLSEIAGPLKLRSTSVLTTPDLPRDVRRALGETPRFAVYSGAGAILSNAPDLLAFGRAVLRGPLLSAASRDLLLKAPPRFGYIGPATFRATIATGGRTLAVVDRPGGIGDYAVRLDLIPEADLATLVQTSGTKVDLGAVYARSGLAYTYLSAVLSAGR